MNFPTIDPVTRLSMLEPPTGRVRAVIDTDTYNEIDDQFAVTQAILSPDRYDLEALYAAPFQNARSSGPADGMEKSYEEILRLLSRLNRSADGFVFKGSTGYLADPESPQVSPAAEDLVKKASERNKGTLYVVAIGAITNVASAILLDPSIIDNIVVVWMGGHAYYWHTAGDFNLKQDALSARIVFDSGVPIVHIPGRPVTDHLLTTVPEIERHVAGKSAIGDYLAKIFAEYTDNPFGWSKPIWDIAAISWIVDASWVTTVLDHSPIVTDQLTYSRDTSRHFVRVATSVDRDAIFRDVFSKIQSAAG